jgi:hypothetical protein
MCVCVSVCSSERERFSSSVCLLAGLLAGLCLGLWKEAFLLGVFFFCSVLSLSLFFRPLFDLSRSFIHIRGYNVSRLLVLIS